MIFGRAKQTIPRQFADTSGYHQEDHVEGDHVHDHHVATVLHQDFDNDWSRSPFSAVLVACLQKCFSGIHGVAASLIGLNDRVVVSASNVLLPEYLRNSSFPTLLRQINSARSASILVHAFAFAVSGHGGSAPRSFRILSFVRGI